LVHFHKLRSRRPPPPFPHLTNILVDPRHLTRFLRSCVLLTARRLVTSSGSFAVPNAGWIDCIVARYSSGVIKKVEVRRLHGGL